MQYYKTDIVSNCISSIVILQAFYNSGTRSRYKNHLLVPKSRLDKQIQFLTFFALVTNWHLTQKLYQLIDVLGLKI
jgi:hypothetical protein